MDVRGTSTLTLDIDSLLNSTDHSDILNNKLIHVDCKVTEFYTNIIESGRGSTMVAAKIYTMSFDRSPRLFHAGMPYVLQVFR